MAHSDAVHSQAVLSRITHITDFYSLILTSAGHVMIVMAATTVMKEKKQREAIL